MKTKLWILLSFLCIGVLSMQAQDVHFSNYRFAPLYFNPANTGGFLGNYRVTGVARDQSRWIINPFQSQMVAVDMTMDKGLQPHHWIGAGLSVYNDQAGDIGKGGMAILLSGAYHWAFDKKYNTVLTVGAQYGMVQIKLKNADNALFEDGQASASLDYARIDGGGSDPFATSYSDVNIGFLLSKKINKETTWRIGAAVYHAVNKGFQYNGGTVFNKVKPRINVHTAYRAKIQPQFIIEPRLYFSTEVATDIAIQFNSEILFDKKKDDALIAGLGYRVGDAMQIMLGGRYRKWELGATYDLTVSSQSTYNNTFGGVELGLTRIFTVNKKPKIESAILCPRF